MDKIRNSKLLAELEQCVLRNHLCLIYEGHKDQVGVTVPFMQIGLERNEKCIYMVDENSITRVAVDLKFGGIDVDVALDSGSLVITDRNLNHLRDDNFDLALMIKTLENEVKKAKSTGFSGLRVTCEMTWFLDMCGGNEKKLVEYETNLTDFFSKNDTIALCQFKRSNFTDEAIVNIIKTHPIVIYQELVCNNFYYVPPREFLQLDSKFLEVKRLLDNLMTQELGEIAVLESRQWFEELNEQLREEIDERKGIEEHIRLRANQQAAIADLGQAALESFDSLKLLKKAVNLIATTLNVKFVKVVKLLPGNEDFLLCAGVGWRRGLVGKARVRRTLGSQAGYTLNINNPVIVEDLNTETRFTPSLLLLNHKVVSGVTVIIQGHDKPFGILGVHTTKRRLFNRNDVNFLKSIANLLAEAIERKQTAEKLKEFAINLESDRKELSIRSHELLETNKVLKKEIDDRKKAEEDVKNTNEFLQKIMSSVTNAIFVINLDGKFSFMNLASSKVSGYNKEELIDKPFSILVDPKDCDIINEQFFKASVLGISISQFETAIVRKDGERRFITFSLLPIYHGNKIVSVVGTAEDITMRKFAEKELHQRASEHEALSLVSRFLIMAETEQVIYDKVPALISKSFDFEVVSIELHDSKTDKLQFKGSVGIPEKALEIRLQEPMEGTVSGDVITGGKAILLSNVQNNPRYKFRILKKLKIKTFACLPMKTQDIVIGTLCLASSQPVSMHTSMELILQTIADTIAQAIKRKQAEQKLKEYHLQLEELVEKRTSELKATHDKLIHSAKLSAVGKLTASIAHEFNNPICGIRNVLERINERIIDETSLDDTHKELASLAIKECTRVAMLIKKLQNFQKPSSEIMAALSIHDAIDEMILMSKKRLKERKIVLETFYANNIPIIEAVSDQIKQVILNLIQNAEDAIPKRGGKITISTELNGSFVNINIHDTGSGIPHQQLSTIFEPFFTTKPAVKGTGLGLSISYSIIKKHGGSIEVKSCSDYGTTFTIVLPVKTVNLTKKEEGGE